MQYPKVSEALNGHGSMDSLATASSDNYHVGRVLCCCLEVLIQQMFWFGALSANTAIIMITCMILSPSVKTSKMAVGVRG